MSRIRAEPGGVIFGYTSPSGYSYKSLFYHQGSANPNKGFWMLTPTAEYAAFDECDQQDWRDRHGSYWYVALNAALVLGSGGERLAHFPYVRNHPGPWHGYPVAPIEDEADEVPEEVIRKWEACGRINGRVASKLRKGGI